MSRPPRAVPKPDHPRGGVLFDLFLILVVCAGALLAWRTRDRWRGALPDRFPFTRSSSPAKPAAGEVTDLGAESARVQADVRRFLDSAGLTERDILKSYAQERRDASAVWLEATLEFSLPARFNQAAFLKELVRFVDKGPSLLRDDDEGGRWTLEFGDRTHVFQRVVLRRPPKTASDIFKRDTKR